MDSLAFYLLLLVSLTAVANPTVASATTIGVTYSTPRSISGSELLFSPERIAEKVVSMKIPAVRLLDSDPAMLRAFADTNVSLFISVPNPLVPLLASNRSLATAWVNRHVAPFYPRTNISIISVGNDVTSDSPDVSPFLLPAMENVHGSLRDLGIHKIPVSTTLYFFNILPAIFFPSAARFQQPKGEDTIRPILQFLERTNSSFLLNLHPYNVYESSFIVPFGHVIFDESPLCFIDDYPARLRYRNSFDMMVDAVITSMAAMGHKDLPLIVAETGWPSSGVETFSEEDLTLVYSEMFLRGLLAHLRSGSGTPLRKEGLLAVYVFELVEEEAKGMRNSGLLHHKVQL
ncbi:unnamed protein product [Microthlaspi erraticum]|uniref:glucan endo-1,3-beta-D-glucosidase n=1 Tax=Microthlaspi erraticum TaxID=1685480 RepID=A0A6D2L4R2_9BRAS|nr:unnamed protein product [Microthlaspi erraticum]